MWVQILGMLWGRRNRRLFGGLSFGSLMQSLSKLSYYGWLWETALLLERGFWFGDTKGTLSVVSVDMGWKAGTICSFDVALVPESGKIVCGDVILKILILTGWMWWIQAVGSGKLRECGVLFAD
jgi:hypothetical protein